MRHNVGIVKMDVEEYFRELEAKGHSYEKCGLHFCADFDEMPICKCSPPEWDCCDGERIEQYNKSQKE